MVWVWGRGCGDHVRLYVVDRGCARTVERQLSGVRRAIRCCASVVVHAAAAGLHAARRCSSSCSAVHATCVADVHAAAKSATAGVSISSADRAREPSATAPLQKRHAGAAGLPRRRALGDRLAARRRSHISGVVRRRALAWRRRKASVTSAPLTRRFPSWGRELRSVGRKFNCNAAIPPTPTAKQVQGTISKRRRHRLQRK